MLLIDTRMKAKSGIIFLIILNLSFPGFAETIPGLKFLDIKDLDRDTLQKQGEYSRIHNSSSSDLILKNHPFSREIEKILDSEKSPTRLEILYLWKAKNLEIEGEELFLFLFNTMNKISALKGITYYSASSKRERILFTEAAVIQDPENPILLPDPFYKDLPDFSRLFAGFLDTRFGYFLAEIQYRVYKDSLCLSLKNVTPLYMLQHLQVASPGALQIYVAVFPGKEEYLFYGFASADLGSLPGFQRSKEESLYNRLNALKNWFFLQLQDSVKLTDPK